MVAGGIALAGAKYAEEAAERDAQLALIEEERQQLALAPEEETAELAALYEAKGLSPHLAREVATELTAGMPSPPTSTPSTVSRLSPASRHRWSLPLPEDSRSPSGRGYLCSPSCSPLTPGGSR